MESALLIHMEPSLPMLAEAFPQGEDRKKDRIVISESSLRRGAPISANLRGGRKPEFCIMLLPES